MSIHRLFGLSMLSLFLLSSPVLAQTVAFVDGSGAPAGFYLENTRVHVRVEDSAGNSVPWIADTMDVALRTALGGDFEYLRLTETGADTGVFEGGMDLAQSASPFPNLILETAVQAGPPVVRDTLTVEYVPFYAPPITATAGMVGARIQLLDDRGQPAAGYTEGDWINVRVEDHVLANDPGTRGSATAVVSALFAGDDELLYLQETGNATGIYEGRIQAVLDLSSDGDGVVGSPPGSPVHGQYAVTDAPETVAAETQLVGSRAEILNAAGEPADFVAESSTIRLRVVDRLTGNPNDMDTVQAAVSSAIGLDEETVTLTETYSDSGVFESTLPTSIDPAIPGNGRLETSEDAGPPHRFDTITLAYGSWSGSSDTAVTYGSETLFVDGFGNDAPSYAAGTAVHVRVIDYNRDQSAARDTVTATVMSLMTGDSETLTLTETGERTAVFEGSLPLAHPFSFGGSPGDGELQAQIGETVEARHTDALGNTASGDRAAIRFAQVEIFDEQGRPTGEVLEGGLVRIRAYDVLANFDSFTADAFYVTVRSGLNPDYEMPQLTETGPDTGIFEGSIRLAFSTEFSPDSILATTNSGPPSYEQDTVTVEHQDARATAVTVGARIQLIDRFGADAERFALGDLVGVRVEDHNADGDPLSRQTLQVTILGNNEEEQVSVLETGNATGVFEGSIPTRLVYDPNPTSSNGALEVYGYHRFEALHPWAHSPRIASDTALTSQSAVRFVDAQGKPVASYLEATVAWVWLISAAGNSPYTVDTATVAVSAAISQDGESLALMETGPDTGIFMGSIPLSAGAPSPGDGLLQTGRSADGLDTLTVTHGSPYDQASDTAAITGSRIWFVDAYGNLTDDYARGSRVHVRVEDHASGTVEVALSSLTTGDVETLALQEAAPDSGIFEGSMDIDSSGFFPYPSDGRLQANGGDEVEAVYTVFSGAPPSSDRARITYGSVDFVDETGAITFEVLENGVARLRVFDAYDSDPFYNFVYVTVRTLYGNDSEPVMLTETSAGSLVYEGTIQLATVPPGTGFGFNSLLETSNGANGPEQLTAEYFDDVARATVVASRAWFIDAFGREAASFAAGERVGVRVEDHNLDDPFTRGTLTVQVRSELGDFENVALTETDIDTNVYEGSIASGIGIPASFDGVLSVQPGVTIVAEHGNVNTQAVIAGASVLFVDEAGNPADVYLEGSRAWVRVMDVSAAGTVDATLSTTMGTDAETLALTETAPGSGLFLGSIALGVSDLAPYDGVLTTVPGNDTLRAEYGGATATAALVGSRTWFVDAYGNPTDDYARGSRVYVRVEDHTSDGPGVYDTVEVALRSLTTGDSETLTLHEKWFSGGFFEGSMTIDSSGFFPYPSDGRLQAGPDEIEVTHTGLSGEVASSDRARITYGSVDFVDETGAITFEVVENGVARLRVFEAYDPNPDNNIIYVMVRSLYGNDSEPVMLTETAFGTLVYEGTVQLGTVPPGTGFSFNGLLETSASDQPEQLTAEFFDDVARATVVASRVRFVGLRGEVVTKYAMGSEIRVRVEDHNLGSAGQVDTIQVSLLASGDAETLALTETGEDTGIFDGSIPSSAAPGSAQDGTLAASPLAAVTAEHTNANTQTSTVARAFFTDNFAPIAVDDTAETVAAPVVIAVLANDTEPEGEPLAMASITQGAHGSVANNFDGTVTYTPAAEFVGIDTFTYIIADPRGDEARATVTVTVLPANAVPVAANDAATTAEDQAVNIAVLANDSDPDGDSLTVIVGATTTSRGTITVEADNTITYTPNPNVHGSDSFTYLAVDPYGFYGYATVTITVTPVNDLPVATDDTATVAEDGSVTVPVLANDSDLDNDTLAVTAVTQGAHGTVTLNPVTYTPNTDYSGADSFTYTIGDGNGGSATAMVTVTVTPVNDAPVAVDDTASAVEDGSVTMTVLANETDVENDTLAVTTVTQGANGSAVLNADGTVTYTPAANWNGTDSFTYTVSDGNGGTDTATVTVTVTPVNDAPIANDDSSTAAEDGFVTVPVLGNDTDLDNDTLAVTAVTQGAHGTVTLNPVTYTPNANFFGTDSFTYTASDGNGGTATATVTITVISVNDAPVAVDDSATTLAETPVTIEVRTNDLDIDSPALTITAVTQGAHGSAAIDAGETVTYTPAAEWIGPDTFTYTISDGAGGTATATVSVDVQAPPRVSSDIQVLYTFEEGSGTTVNDVSGIGAPLDLTVGDPSAVSWLPGALSIDSETLVESAETATKVVESCKATNEVTVEAWVLPSDLSQDGPAPIVTMSQNPNKRNVTLGQSGTAYNGQLRTSSTSKVGSQLDAAGTASLGLSHVVYTRSSTGATRIYVNGIEAASGTLAGDLSAWEDFNLALGGELAGPRYWTGDLHLVAIYSRALTSTEVRQNWLAGAN